MDFLSGPKIRSESAADNWTLVHQNSPPKSKKVRGELIRTLLADFFGFFSRPKSPPLHRILVADPLRIFRSTADSLESAAGPFESAGKLHPVDQPEVRQKSAWIHSDPRRTRFHPFNSRK